VVSSGECPGENDVELVKVNGRVFRRTKIAHKSPSNAQPAPKMKEMQDEYSDEQCLMEENLNIVKDAQTSSYKLSFPVPNVFYKFIIGKSGNTKNKIQNETGATILVPRPNEPENIVIRGPSESVVASAKTRIDIIIEAAIPSLPYTHFLSIPLNDPQLQKKLHTLYTDITSRCGSIQGLDKTILVDPAQFHLTILMLKLYTQDALTKASKLLKESSKKLYDMVGSRTVVMHLQGLEYMNDDPHAVDVLYVKVHPVDGSQRLADVCKYLVDVFSMANLISPQDRDVKLHATLINTRYRQESNIDNNKEDANKYSRQSIDATPILQNFGEVDLGTYRVGGVHLSHRGRFDNNGYWTSIESVALP